MEKISASKLLAGLVPAGKLTSDPEVALVTTDSREVKPGCIFVAFPGERFDGHDFAARALELGVYVIGFSFPVVPRGQARIRTQMSAAHTFDQIDRTVEAFKQAGRELGVIR